MAEVILADVEASGIYQIRNTVNGKIYVGSAKCFRKRWAVHMHGFRHSKHPNRYLMRAWGKYGAEAFRFEILETCNLPELIVREQFWIDTLRPSYNLAPKAGNCLGVKHSEETRRRVSERNKGNKYALGKSPSAKCREAVSRANKGRKGHKRSASSVEATARAHRGMKRSDETRRRISESRKGKKLKEPRSAEYRMAVSLRCKGRKISDEHMSAFQAGRKRQVYTDERRQKVSENFKKQWADPEYRKKVLEKRKLTLAKKKADAA